MHRQYAEFMLKSFSKKLLGISEVMEENKLARAKLVESFSSTKLPFYIEDL